MTTHSYSRLTVALSLVLCAVLPALFLPRGYPAAWFLCSVLLAVAAAWLHFRHAAVPAPGRDALRVVIYCFAAYILSFLFTMLFHNASLRELDKPIRYVLGIVLLLCLMRTPLDPRAVRAMILLAGFTAFFYAAYDVLVNDALRAGAFMNQIQFGVLSAQVAVLNAVLALGQWGDNRRHAWAFVAGSLAALAAAVMSGSLTAVGSLAALPLALIIAKWRLPSLKAALVTLLIGSAVLAALVQTRSPAVMRGFMVMEEIAGYKEFKAGVVSSSSNGSRLENFANAWSLFLAAPVMGVGPAGYLAIRKEQVRRGELTAYTGSLGVAHNEYLDALAKRGILGLAGLLALLFGPLLVFRKVLRESADDESRTWAVAGMTVGIGIALASLAQNLITHSSGANFLIVATVVLLRLSVQERQVSASTSPAP